MKELKGLTPEEREFLASTSRGVNTSIPWINARLPDLRVVIVDGTETKRQPLEELANSLSRTRHLVRKVPIAELTQYTQLNDVDFVIIGNSASLPEDFKQRETVIALKQGLDTTIQTTQPNATALMKRIAQLSKIAPVNIVSKDKDEAELIAKYIELTGTYFDLKAYSVDSFTAEKPDGLIVYLQDPIKNNSLEDLKLIKAIDGTRPVVFVSPQAYLKDFTVQQLFEAGITEFVGTDLAQDLRTLGKYRRPDLAFSLERITNAIHGTIQAENPSKSRFDYAREIMPYVYIHASRHRVTELRKAILRKISANFLHPHTSRIINKVNTDPKAVDEAKKVVNFWKPNVIYLELMKTEPEFETVQKVIEDNHGYQFVVAFEKGTPREYIQQLTSPSVVFARKEDVEGIADKIHQLWNRTEHPKRRASFSQRTQLLQNIQPRRLEHALCSRFDTATMPEPELTGIPIYPGAAAGLFYDNLKDAMDARKKGERVIFYVEDLAQLPIRHAKKLRTFDGIVFSNVSSEDHFTIDFARSGIPMIKIDRKFAFDPKEPISFDGSTGRIYKGSLPIVPPPRSLTDLPKEGENNKKLLEEVDRIIKSANTTIMMNADTVAEMRNGRQWGVDQIGLVRTENLIKSDAENIKTYVRLLLSYFSEDKAAHSELIRESQTRFVNIHYSHFMELLRYQQGKRTQIRLLDAPIQDLLSQNDLFAIVQKENSFPAESYAELYNSHSGPPIKGVQIFDKVPDVYKLQLRALFTAYRDLRKEGIDSDLRIFIPFVVEQDQVRRVLKAAEEINQKEFEGKIPYRMGVTIETPGGCIHAPKIMRDYGIKDFAFGTNDLFPLVEGSGRQSGLTSYTKQAEDGTPLLSSSLVDILEHTLDGLDDAARIRGMDYSIGLCGEMNEIKLHPENLGRLVPRIHYFSAGRARQIPVLKLLVAQALYRTAV